MSKAQHIYYVGDVHGDWSRMNAFINSHIRQNREMKQQAALHNEFEVVILQCGDFGYWPHTEPRHSFFEPENPLHDQKPYALKNEVAFVKDGRVKLYWCDGNHENHDCLDALECLYPHLDFIPVMPEVYFARFGSVLTLLDGTAVMFCGGAVSDDAHLRTPGTEWWPQEAVTPDDMQRLPDPITTKVNWIISHTSPLSFEIHSQRLLPSKNQDRSRLYLEMVRQRFRPSYWWHGHYHLYETGEYEGCRWTCLDYIGHSTRWYATKFIVEE